LLDAAEVMCFERDDTQPGLQLSAFQRADEPGMRYFRGSAPEKQVGRRRLLLH